MLKIHKLCECLPEMDETSFKELKDSIERNGQRQPIVTVGNEILKGRHRYRACIELGVPPAIRAYDPERDGISMTEAVIDEDLRRRHLSPGQRAAVFASLMQHLEEFEDEEEQPEDEPAKKPEVEHPEEQPEEQPEVEQPAGQTASEEDGVGEDLAKSKIEKEAHEAGVSVDSLNKAKQVLKSRPDLIKRVIDKEISLNQAKKIMQSEDPGVEQERAEAADILAEELGNEFSEAIRDKTILKGDELKAFVALSAALRGQIQDLIVENWKVSDAVKYVRGYYLQQDTIGDMINRFNQIGKEASKVIVDGYEITVKKAKEGEK